MKYKLELSYQGGNYHGWQRQKNASSVQETIEDVLAEIIKKKYPVIGCGRTDTGVHASKYVAHINISEALPSEFLFRINKRLPPDIAIHSIEPAPSNFHAQHHAISRTYTYHLHSRKHALLHATSTWFDLDQINLDMLKETLDFLKDVSDFSSLCRNPKIYNTTICHIQSITIHDDALPEKLAIEIKANRFLRAMIRLIISKVLKVASGHLSINTFKERVTQKVPFDHFDPAPPQGLWLTDIRYKEE